MPSCGTWLLLTLRQFPTHSSPLRSTSPREVMATMSQWSLAPRPVRPSINASHRYVKATWRFLQKMLLNKATYDGSFANSSPIFTTFGILVNNDVDRSHDCGCHRHHFGRKICVTIITKMGIILNWLAKTEYTVCHTLWYIIGKLIPSACLWCLGNFDIMYIKGCMA